MSLSAARDLFEPDPNLIYLDAGTYGLPPRPTVEASLRALRDWQTGTADYARDWEPAGEQCRDRFARLIGAPVEEIALVPSVSAGVGIVAASLPDGAEALVPKEEFTSVALPFYAAAQAREITVREAPYAELADAVRPSTTLVALSLTRAQSGETADLGPIREAARRHGARVLLDTTHATPFVPVAEHLEGIDFLVCHGYKHLLCPRGVAFLRIRRERWAETAPILANWKSAGRSYGGPLGPAANAARFDVSLAWHAWVGAAPALALFLRWQEDGTLAAAKGLADRLARGLELPPPRASLVCVRVEDAERAAEALAAAGVRGAARGGYVRLTPHVYNTVEEIDHAVDVMNGVLGAG